MLTLLDLELGVWVTLKNNERVLIRRFRRTDGDALYDFFINGLSEQSKRLYSLQPLDWSLVQVVVSEADARKCCGSSLCAASRLSAMLTGANNCSTRKYPS